MSKEISKEKTNSLLNCPFCGVSLKKIGSKRRGNQFYVHDYKGPDCILKEFSFKADDEEKMKHWNTRKPMERIVERLEEELELTDKEKRRCVHENPLQFDEAKGYARGIANAIEIVKEEGGIDGKNL